MVQPRCNAAGKELDCDLTAIFPSKLILQLRLTTAHNFREGRLPVAGLSGKSAHPPGQNFVPTVACQAFGLRIRIQVMSLCIE